MRGTDSGRGPNTAAPGDRATVPGMADGPAAAFGRNNARAAANATVELERRFARFIGIPSVLAVRGWADAVTLGLRALNLPRGGQVAMPALVHPDLPRAVIGAGRRPVILEIGADLRLDLDALEAALRDDIAAVIISHGGLISDMDAIQWLCEARGIPLIEDVAQAPGGRWRGRRLGTFGAVGAFAFQSQRTFNAGEVGMIAGDPDIVARAARLAGRSVGNGSPDSARCVGQLAATLARAQIDEIDVRAERARHLRDRMAALLDASPHFAVPPAHENEQGAPAVIQFALRGAESDAAARAFVARAQSAGVPVQILGLGPQTQRAFWTWAFIGPHPGLARSRALLRRLCELRLPVALDEDAVRASAEALIRSAEAVSPRRDRREGLSL